MTDTRARRLRASPISSAPDQLASQEEATERLGALGFAVTQATVSRDLEQLGAVKVKRGGVLSYALPDQIGAADWSAGRLERILREWVCRSRRAGQMIVIRTPPGSAHLVASAIDHAALARNRRHRLGRRHDVRRGPRRRRHPRLLRRFERMMGQAKEEYA